jgi:non-specific serine/threonine protein kinase
MKLLSPDEVRSRLGDRFRLLVPDSRLALSRHETLEETIQWSYDMLSEGEQCVVRELAVFIGGWTLESATSVCDLGGDEFAALDFLNRLVDKSLVVVDRIEGQPTRYRFLETVRQFAYEKLKSSRADSAVRRRHLEYFLSVAEGAEGGLVGADQAQWLIRLERDHENIVGAIRWSLDEGFGGDEALRMAGALWRFWNTHGYFGLGRGLLSAALDHQGQGPATAARVRALRGAGILAYYQGEYETARTLLEESLAVSRMLGDRVGEARALNALGGISLELGDYPPAREQFGQCAEISREIGDRGGVALALGNMGTIARYQGDDQTARMYYEEALALVREIGHQDNTASLLFDLGALATRSGGTEQARSRLLECALLVQELGEKRTGAYALEGAGDLLARLGLTSQAVRLYGAAATLRASIEAPLTHYEEGEQKAKVDQARAVLGPSAFDLEWIAGEGLSFETALDFTVQWLRNREVEV